MIIAVEGIDGAGKNTLVTALKGLIDARTLSFPRYEDSVHAQLAQEALHGRMGDLTDSAYAMATLFALDRAGVAEELRPYKGAQDRMIILDRYVASNAAYSAARTGDDGVFDWVYQLEFERLGLPTPDLQVLLATAPEEASARAKKRESEDSARARDRYERDSDLQNNTYAAYVRLAEQNWAGRWVHSGDSGVILQEIEKL
ncbi:dTMP kinase [Corynebacterium breve]|uniref:Thymidylate kinase n=1 Tax=Corynebacterium breve TaxID=3049799 RepID=A0ABY8VGQ9_9CORY|nr:dTMP kinase [Corynebacterium breve]WIM68267.1 dTMP kinase [Corynebacterium breve]